MPQIKAVSVAINEAGSLYIVDSEDQLWLRTNVNGQWSQVDLPDEQETEGETLGGVVSSKPSFDA